MSNEELVEVIQAGAPERMGELWEQVRRFVVMKARHVPLEGRTDCELDDLIQSGYLALADAVASYEPGEHSFLTHLGYHLKTQFAIATRFRSERQQRETLAGALSLDAPVSSDADANTLAYYQEDPSGVAALEDVEERIYQDQLRKAVAEVLAELPEDRRELLRLRFWEDATLQEIADIQGTTPERIRQKEYKALREIRKPATAIKLRHFYTFDYYGGTSLGAFRSTGTSIQERYLMKQDSIRERQECRQKLRMSKQHREAFEEEMKRLEEETRERVARMTPEEKRALLEQYGYA